MRTHYKLKWAFLMLPLLGYYGCKKDLPNAEPELANAKGTIARALATEAVSRNEPVSIFLTTGDQTKLLHQEANVNFALYGAPNTTTVTIDENTTYQGIDGFGFMLTGGATTLLNGLGSNQSGVLNELFGTGPGQIGISYLRVSIGASDLSATDFTYDETVGDVSLTNFSINAELVDLIPVLKKILAINPNIKILATPWTAPTWMKVNPTGNNGFTGGSLNTSYYDAYARYFVKYLQAMQAQGITIDAITPQNEPLNPYNNPSMLMQANEQANFIKNNLGPQIRGAGFATKIICYDLNPDNTTYPETVLADAGANQYVDGSAFHLYLGSINSLTDVHNAYPAKNIYFTEQYTGYPGSFAGDLAWHISNLIIGAPKNWSRNVIEWTLATDPSQGPHTVGGCGNCLGGITVNGTAITRNVGYYIIAHASKFVRPGAVRISSTISGSNIQGVAFKNLDGSKVLIALNSGSSSQAFNVQWGSESFAYTIPASAVATFQWNGTQSTATGPPIGQTITLKGFNGLYVNGENGTQAMHCDSYSVLPAEQFLVVDAGGGKIALQSLSKYVSSENGTQPITCNRATYGVTELFTWVNNTDGSISLMGNNGKYVSDEQGLGILGLGLQAMTCNRATASSWEEFGVNK